MFTSELAAGLSQHDIWVSEKVWMRCERVVNMTDRSVLTASPQSSLCGLTQCPLPGHPAGEADMSRVTGDPVNVAHGHMTCTQTKNISNVLKIRGVF